MTAITPHQFSDGSSFAHRRPVHRRPVHRSGFTLVEILIALTMTLIVLFAMAQAFQFASGEIASGRAVLEMSNRLRNAQQLMRTDLAGLTVDVRPHTETTPSGFFENVDGPSTDKSATGTADGYLGDIDDILAFTTRSLDSSFRGRFLGNTLQSSYAEVIWFTQVNDINNDGIIDVDGNLIVDFTESVALYRRVLLIRPDLNTTFQDTGGNSVFALTAVDTLQQALEFFSTNDISARYVPLAGRQDLIIANSLRDLARRENRFARDSTLYPHVINRDFLSATRMGAADGFSGDDILLTDIAAFDVKIYSPTAPVDLIDLDGNNVAETAVNPSDIGFVGTHQPPNQFGETRANGGFVDLAKGNVAGYVAFNRSSPFFMTLPTPRSLGPNFGNSQLDFFYCTWSPHYETDGIDQDGIFGPDQGTNGLDDDGINGVDDDGERETSPPYPFPVRGIEVTFRIIEKNTRQVRQTSVIQNFLPQ